MRFEDLRLDVTQNCIEMTLELINFFKSGKKIVYFPQRKEGRYYSYMPAELKKICFDFFNKHIDKL